jgi:hypothetical protein
MAKIHDFPARVAVAMLALALTSGGSEARDLYRWVQYVPGGLEARAITDDATCPTAMIDGVRVAMAERSTPGENYPVRACTLPIGKDAKLVTLNGRPMPLPKPRPNRILIIGDTGCRLKGAQVQACNDMSAWPFRLGADLGAKFKPDLVLHVGDMHYRETDCPAGNLGCAGTPFGDTWDVWKEDFFKPGEALLGAAPWLMVRGNHEECDRGGKGWARTLDPYAFDPAAGAAGCLGPQAPYSVDLGGVMIVMMDVSTAAEKADAKQVASYREQFALPKSIPGPVWMAFHRPIWAVDFIRNGQLAGDNQTLAAAARDTVPANVQAFLSGHHHVFEVMTYDNDLPIQIVSGHGGDDLSTEAPAIVKGLTINGVKVTDGIARPGIFGFSMIERDPADMSGTKWTLTGYDNHGAAIGKCQLDGRKVVCE